MVSIVNLVESIVGRLEEETLVRIPASWDEYWTLLQKTRFSAADCLHQSKQTLYLYLHQKLN